MTRADERARGPRHHVTDQLRIIHIFRAPVGGLFRHVGDLVRAQVARGHEVGIICDAATGGEAAERELSHLASHCALGIKRFAMSRHLGPRDLTAFVTIQQYLAPLKPDILHGHGAKGGAYARLACNQLRRWQKQMRAFYTPHGGSLHYSALSLKGRLYLALERRLAAYTDGLIFESDYSRAAYEAKIGRPRCPTRVIHNGLKSAEFYNYRLHDTAVEFVFVGELRRLKGVDVLLRATALLAPDLRPRVMIVGGGPDKLRFRREAKRLGLAKQVTFTGPRPARQAFAQGQCLVLPSRAESLPYIVLEAAAARVPMILTNVGGIPEIIGDTGLPLVPPDNVPALRDQMLDFLRVPEPFLERAGRLQARVAELFSLDTMVDEILDFYRLGTSDNNTRKVRGKRQKAAA